MSDVGIKTKDVCVVCGAFDIIPKGKPEIKEIKEIRGLCDECASFIPERQWGRYE